MRKKKEKDEKKKKRKHLTLSLISFHRKPMSLDKPHGVLDPPTPQGSP